MTFTIVRTTAMLAALLVTGTLAWAQDRKAGEYPLVEAVECRARDGLPNVLGKLRAGAEVRIAYFGGSITAQDGWRPKTLKWFQQQFPNAKISETNAAIGGTGSDLGVFRHRHDVLQHKPDLLFVEFAVNDGGTAPEQIHRSMEGIVRQTWTADANTDICYVYTVTQALVAPMLEGKFPRAASAMEKLADHYGIPSIHMGMEVARLAKEGKLVWAAPKPKTDAEKEAMKDKLIFAADGVHPYTDTGHQLYLEAVVRSMEKIKPVGKASPHALGKPLVADNWEKAQMLPLDRAKLSAGWTKMDMVADKFAKGWAGRMPQMWKADKPGESLTFRFKGTTAAVYSLLGPDCGQVSISVDGKPAAVRPLFDRYCTYHRLAMLTLGANLPDSEHTVKIEIHPDQPDKDKIFRDGKQDAETPSQNPKKYDGRAWYAGSILIVGELVE